jgi:Nucleotidyltransferase of unknown function (DUF6036)
MNEYNELFADIDSSLMERFGKLNLPLKLIGYSALVLAGLPDRGTKDVDALEEGLRIETIQEEQLSEIVDFLNAEFGKKSPGDKRHGIYLDIVGKAIPWFPPQPRFIDVAKLESCTILRLTPVDICVSKTFSNFKKKNDRASDRKDILDALDADLFNVSDYIDRLNEALPTFETHAEAPEVFPRVIKFIADEIIPTYDKSANPLTYKLPSWMENI